MKTTIIEGVEYGLFRRKGFSTMRPYIVGEDMTGISVSSEDTPGLGGMIAVNPKNPADKWYVAEDYFLDNLEPAEGAGVDDEPSARYNESCSKLTIAEHVALIDEQYERMPEQEREGFLIALEAYSKLTVAEYITLLMRCMRRVCLNRRGRGS